MDNWEELDEYHKPPDGIEDRRSNTQTDFKLNHLFAKQKILESQVGDHDKIIGKVSLATEENTQAIREINATFKDGIKTAKTAFYIAVAFFILNFYGWEAVLKGLTGIGK